jgi:hypothetical protein
MEGTGVGEQVVNNLKVRETKKGTNNADKANNQSL